VCCEYAARGSLHDLLELGALHIDKARQFTVELLEAIDFLHRNGVAHGLLNTINVVIVDGPTPSPKLAEFGYPQFLQGHNEAQSKWQAPDGDKTSTAAQRKSDIWDFGKVVAQMFLGSQITTQYSSPQLMLSRLDCSDSFDDFLRKMFVVESKKRPSAFDLLAAEFLRTNDPVMEQDQLTAPPTLRSSSGGGSSFFTSPGKRRSRHNSSNILDPVSRYAQEFTEISRLGKGGFGEVVKARNKLDGGLYAIKKVKKAPHLLDQVISEVMVLQKLNHPYVTLF
jgi:translation initiation factor 2-alpha kinase 4